MTIEIANIRFDRKLVCLAEHEVLDLVTNGDLDTEARFAYVCAMDPSEDIFGDETCWIKAT